MSQFTPFTKNTSNIMDTIKEVAADRNLKKGEIDFDLISVQTLIQSTKHKDWTIIDESVETIFEKKELKSKSFHIKQEYEINIRPPQKHSMFEKVDISIASNKSKSKVIATFKKGSIFPCSKNLLHLLKQEIERKKLRLGLLTEHFEGNLNSTLAKFVQILSCKTPLPKDIRIIIAQSPGPIFAVDDSVILHYKELMKDKEKSFIDGVDANELIFEYIKPINGKNGRNAKGEYVIAPEPKRTYASYAPDPQTIRIEEDDKTVKYYSIVDGYVKDSAKIISISKEIALESASFQGTGSIDTGEDKDISVSINTKSSSDDAVGSGVSIDVKEINVKGTVGSNAKVKAQELNVGEQTHRNSQLQALENANIHLHRGKLKAKTAKIDILENGLVEADDVHVKKMLGGEIIGRRVIVEEITSNTVIIASESIEVHKISGEHNELIINPDKIQAYHENIQILKAEIKEKKSALAEIKEKHEKKILEHHKRADRIKVFQQRVLAATKALKAPNKPDIIRIKQYKSETQALKDNIEVIDLKESELASDNNELDKLYEAEFHAQVINKGKYNGHSKVIFVDTKTAQEYTMIPDGKYEKLFLEKNGDDKVIAW